MDISQYIDSTLLDPKATMKDIETLCNDALTYHFEAVCVHPYYVSLAKELLKDSNVLVSTVIGFPMGMNTTSTKVYEAIEAVNHGADEIELVINMGDVKNKQFEEIKEEIEEIRDSIDGKTLKVIVEVGSLTKEELIKLINICNETFVHYIKTSTGFFQNGTVEDVKLIKEHKSDTLEIKAAGGIQTEEQLLAYIEAGATRIGTSHAALIMKGEKQ